MAWMNYRVLIVPTGYNPLSSDYALTDYTKCISFGRANDEPKFATLCCKSYESESESPIPRFNFQINQGSPSSMELIIISKFSVK